MSLAPMGIIGQLSSRCPVLIFVHAGPQQHQQLIKRAITDCADLGIVPTLLRHPPRSRRFVRAMSAQSCPSGATQPRG